MLQHDKCGHSVYIDKTRQIRVLSAFVITSSTIKLTTSTVSQNDTKGSLVFVCPVCKVEVDVAHLNAMCGNCGKTKALDRMFRVTKASGYFCAGCSDELYPTSSKKSLLSVINSELKGDK